MIVQPNKLTKTSRSGFIALGSNRKSGNFGPIDLLTKAIAKFEGHLVHLEKLSSWYGSAAFPAGSGPDFVNAVAKIQTHLPPSELLMVLHQIESNLGRERGARWSARTCDLDLISYETQILPDLKTFTHWQDLSLEAQMSQAPDQLILPHPRLSDRAFVLIPLAEIAPDWVHPVSNLSAQALVDRLPANLQQSVWKL